MSNSRHFDGSIDVWVRQYLTSLLHDPRMRLPNGLLPMWLDLQVDPGAERPRDNLGRLTIQHVIDRSPRSVLLGPAGSGKTLLVRQLVRGLAEEALAQPQALLPLYIPLTFFAGSIEGTLGAQAHMRGPAVATLALQRPCVLIVDALNDVPPTEQLEVLGMLRRAMQQLGPQGRWLINCRTEQWALFAPWLQASRSAVWRIRPWNDQMISNALGKLQSSGAQRLANYPGCIELARRPRWLGSLQALADDDAGLRPGQAGLAWVEDVFTEAARSHCLSDTSAHVGLTLLTVLAQAIRKQPHQSLSRAAVIALTNEVADGVGVLGDELLALLDATGVLDLVGDDEWAFRSVLLTDLAAALEIRHDKAEQWQAAIGRGGTLPLLYSLVDQPSELIRVLIDADAWSEVQRVLDANEGTNEALAVLESTERVDTDSGAALGRVWAQSGNRDVAVALLRWSIGQGRDDPQLYGLLGDIYLQQGQWKAARNVFSDALRREPTNLHYQQALAQACRELGEDDVAAKTLEEVMKTHHRQLAQTAYHLGVVYEQKGRLQEALNQYIAAASLVPSDARFGLAQARVLRLLNRFDEARSLLRSLQAMTVDPALLATEWAALMLAQGNDEQALVHFEHLVELNAATADVYLQIGQIRRRHGQTTEAVGAFSTAIDLDPRCRAAYEQLAGVAIDLNDLQTAASAYRRLAELMPDAADVHEKLGALLRELDQLGDAAQVLRTSLQLAPSADAFLQLARVRWAQGEQAEALRHYRAALELDPQAEPVAAETGWALIESGDPVAALTPLHAAAQLQPNNARILYDLGRAYELQARRSEALEWYERAATVAPRWIDTLRATGRIAYECGFTPLARTYFARALRLDRKDGDAHADIGCLHLDAGNGFRAVQALRRAVLYGGTQPTLRRDLAQALLLVQQPDEALRWLDQSSDQDADTHELRSRAYEQLGDPRTALIIARTAAALRPRDHRLQRRLGMLALQVGNISEAIAALETAITLGDTDAATQLALSRAMLLAGKLEAALRSALLAVERAPHGIEAYEQLGLVQLKLGNGDQARSAFERAIEQSPESAIGWAGLADVWSGQHSPGAAIPYARHALELDPEKDEHRIRLARLLVEAGDYTEAQTLLRTLRASNAEADRLHVDIAVAMEQWPEAVAAAERALKSRQSDAALLATYGAALIEVGRYADSLPPLTKACAAADAPAHWWALQGRAFMALEQWAAATNAIEQSLQRDQRQPELYAQLAHAYMQQGQAVTAAQALQAALQHGGEYAPWRARLAEAYETLGWHGEALSEWQKAQALEPHSARFSREVGRLQLVLGNIQAALSELEEVTAIDPADRTAWELYAEAALQADDPARAVHAAASALACAPNATLPRRMLGEALLRRGDANRALHCLLPLLDANDSEPRTLLLIHEAAQASNDLQIAHRALEGAFKLAPNDISVQLRLAAHFRASEPARALKLLRSMAQRHPQRADIAATLAEYALDQGELHLARHAAEHAVELAPVVHAYQRLLGHICYRLGDTGVARTKLQEALAYQPHDAATALALGKLALDRNETTEAIRLLKLAVQSDPSNGEALGMLGVALRQRWQPVWEDEAIEPQQDPALRDAIAVLEQAAAQGVIWRGELGWTRLITGDVQGAVRDLADAGRQLPAGSTDRAIVLRRLALALMHADHADEAVTVAGHAAVLAPNDPLIASIQGQLAEQHNDLHEAVRLYARAVALEPEGGRHHLRLGAALLRADELEVALDHLQQATVLEPARASGWISLSEALLRLNQPDRAMSAAQRAIQLGANDAQAWRQLAAAAEAVQQIDTALEAFDRATALEPRGSWFVAYADLALAHGRDERGRAILQRAAHHDPGNSALLYRLAQLSAGAERVTMLQRAVDLEPANAGWRNELAQLLAVKGQHRSAIAHLTQAVDTEPHIADHWLALAEAQLRANEDADAEASLRRGLSFQPQHAALWLALGNLLATRKQWLEAHESFVNAAQAEPGTRKTASALAGQGHCLLNLDRPDQARQALHQALELAPDDAEALSDLAQLHFVQQRWKEAVRDARRAVEINPTLIDAHRTIAEAALKLGGDWINEAHEALEHALAIEPDAPALHALKGWAYYAEGEYEMVLDEARHAIKGAPDEASYLVLEAYALRRMRRFKEAIESLRRAVKLNKNYREALTELMTITTELFMQQGERA